jgi:hypothetical protein
MNNKLSVLITTIIGLLGAALLIMLVAFSSIRQELNSTKIELLSIQEELITTQEHLRFATEETTRLQSELDTTKQELDEATAKIESLGQIGRTYNGWPMCWRTVQLEDWEIDFFAKLLYCEAGSMGYDGQFWVASAILNLSQRQNMSIWEIGHNVNMFEVAPWVDNSVPTQAQYDIINDVLNNGWIADVAYFRTNYPHSFGKFMIQIENVCFNSP